ncbi:hypothetical protein OH77DRAFT_969326 [Trametes cingulata]|nr:hypothetical protein OH77DRAFT_969326 [Trametes cingulata]
MRLFLWFGAMPVFSEEDDTSHRLLCYLGHFRLPWLLWGLLPSCARLAYYHRLTTHPTTRIFQRNAHKLRCGWVLKTVPRTPFPEANNAWFVAENTAIPVPHILDVIQDTESGSRGPDVRASFVMTYVEGETLDSWIVEHTRKDAEQGACYDDAYDDHYLVTRSQSRTM